MAFVPTTSWQIDGEKNGNSDRLYFLTPKSLWMVTAAMKLRDTCSLEGKLWWNLESILKSRDIILLTKIYVVKVMAFPVVMYGFESWTRKKVEYQRIDAFKLWFWRRLIKIPWTARRSNQPILKEINPEYSLEVLMLKLKLCPPDMKSRLIGKDPDAGKDWRQEEKGGTEWDDWMASPTQWTWVWENSGRSWRTAKTGMLLFLGLQRVRHDLATEQ